MNRFLAAISVVGMLSLSAPANVYAQDPNYTGPAKMEVRTFWRQATIFKSGKGTPTTLANMEKALATIKQKDPSYDTVTMQEAIGGGAAKVEQINADQSAKKQEIVDNMKSGSDKLWGKINADKLFEYLFNQSLTTGSPDAAKLQAALTQYNAKAAELLAMDFGARDRSNQGLRAVFTRLDGRVTGGADAKGVEVKGITPQDENEMLGDASEERVKRFFLRLQLTQAKWDAARKLFPGEAGYEKMYQLKTAEIAKYGSVEDLQKNIQNNNAEEIKARRLPAPEIVDAATERLFIESFNKYLSEEVKGKGYKAILKQKDWGIIRNQITGAVMGRKRQAAVAIKGNDGKCYVRFGIIVEQQYIGSTFQNARAFDARYGGGELPCEFAK